MANELNKFRNQAIMLKALMEDMVPVSKDRKTLYLGIQRLCKLYHKTIKEGDYEASVKGILEEVLSTGKILPITGESDRFYSGKGEQ